MDKIKVANIINTHGIKGELKIQRHGIETFDRDIDYFIGKEYQRVKISNSRIHKGFYIIKFNDYNNINDVLSFKGKSLFINESDLLDLDNDEYYILDLIGIEVYESDKLIGTLKEILEYDVNDVYLVETDNGEKLIPAVDEFILNIDIDNNRMDVKLIEGM